MAFFSSTFPIIPVHFPEPSSYFTIFNDSSEKKIKCTLKNISDINLKVKIGEKSIVILGRANHSSKVNYFYSY